MPAYPRQELEAMVERWLAANRQSEKEGDWIRHLGAMYTEDAEYRWNMGPNQEFVARGRQQIEDWALGVHMKGFEEWQYPYDRILIDDQQGEVVGFWRQIAPVKRPDGTPYQVAGLGGSWFRYGGNSQWCWQTDFFDLGNVKALFMELAADGHLEPSVKDRIKRLARGEQLAGVQPIGEAPGLGRRIKGLLAMAGIVVTGS